MLFTHAKTITTYSKQRAELRQFVFRMKKKENEREEEVREEDREPRERRCFQCGDMGHVRRDCPDYKHLRQRAAPGPGTAQLHSAVCTLDLLCNAPPP